MRLRDKILTGIATLVMTAGAAKAVDNISKYPVNETRQVQQIENKKSQEPTLDLDRNIVLLQFIRSANDSNPQVGEEGFVKLYIPRNPPTPLDTQTFPIYMLPGYYTYSNYIYSGSNLNAVPGETLYSYTYYDDTSGRYEAITFQELQDGANFLPPLFFDNPNKPDTAYTIYTENVSDTNSSTLSIPLHARNKVEGDSVWHTVPVDTNSQGNQQHPQWMDFYWNTQLGNVAAGPGRKIITLFEKTRNDSSWWKYVNTTMDSTNTKGNAVHASCENPCYCPEHSPVRDFESENIVCPQGTLDSGTVVVPKISVNNYGIISDQWFHSEIGSYRDSVYTSISPGQDSVSFSPCTLSEVGTIPMTFYSNLVGDVNRNNDTLTGSIDVQSTGINEYEKGDLETKMQVKPTITNDYVNISGIEGKIDVYDVTGRRVANYEFKDKKDGKIDFSRFSPGIYFVRSKGTEEIIKVINTR